MIWNQHWTLLWNLCIKGSCKQTSKQRLIVKPKVQIQIFKFYHSGSWHYWDQSSLSTYNYENSSKISSFLHGQWSAPDGGEVVLPHPAVDLQVDDDQVGEGDDAGGEQPGPVDVVVHVVGVQSIEITIKLVLKEMNYTERAIMNPHYLVPFSFYFE